MKLYTQILSIVLGAIFLVLSSGFLIYKSHCSCTGKEQVSVFIQKEVCEIQDIGFCCKEIANSCCSSLLTEQCESLLSICDCDEPEVMFVKLIDKIVNEELRFTKIKPVQLIVAFTTVQFNNFLVTDNSVDFIQLYIDPPPIHNSSLEFIIQIQQLKIPALA